MTTYSLAMLLCAIATGVIAIGCTCMVMCFGNRRFVLPAVICSIVILLAMGGLRCSKPVSVSTTVRPAKPTTHYRVVYVDPGGMRSVWYLDKRPQIYGGHTAYLFDCQQRGVVVPVNGTKITEELGPIPTESE